MKMEPFRFGTTDWASVGPTQHKGETGTAIWRTRFFGSEANPIRVRMVDTRRATSQITGARRGTFFSASKANSKPRSTTGASSCSRRA